MQFSIYCLVLLCVLHRKQITFNLGIHGYGHIRYNFEKDKICQRSDSNLHNILDSQRDTLSSQGLEDHPQRS